MFTNPSMRKALLSNSKRMFGAKAELAPLPYEINGLEPVLSGHLMEFHYGKHHKTYVTNLNNLVGQAEEALAKNDMAAYVKLSQGIKFNGGGHWNHTFFWESLAPLKSGGGARPDASSELSKMINSQWGDLDKFIGSFSAQTAAIQGSDELEYRTTPN